ncbi:unnamed protein product [Moneuplotes crassus]|uniref:FACT complex subunit n=1 Tax=Euplotes crassus TaxID=5936 RepID=A0AAD1XTE5_EUPCR|nr:unnamed protein product [Moneuplotes crassus]
MGDIKLDNKEFYEKVSRISKTFKESDLGFDTVFCVLGKMKDTIKYRAASTVFLWLLRYEFTETIIAFQPGKVVFFTSQKKLEYLKSLEKPENEEFKDFEVVLVKRDTKEKDKSGNYKKLYNTLKSGHSKKPKISFLKDKIEGSMEGEFKDFLSKFYKTTDPDNADEFFEQVMRNKSDEEKEDIKKANHFCTTLFKNIIDKVEQVVDEEAKCPHHKIIEEVQALIENNNFMFQFIKECASHEKKNIDRDFLEISNPLSIQSGDNLDLSLTASANKKDLSPDTIIITVTTKYKDLFALNSRTLLIDPNEQQNKAYEALFELYQSIMQNLKVGAELRQVYKISYDAFSEKNKELAKFLPKTFGFGIGCKLQEKSLTISPTNSMKVEIGNTFCIRVSLEKFCEKKSRDSLLISETVTINEEGKAIPSFKIKASYKEISYSINEPDEGDGSEEGEDNGVIRQSRLRDKNVKSRGVDERKEHQDQLFIKKLQELKTRFENNQIDPSSNKVKVHNLNEVCSYKSAREFPKEVFKSHIFVDVARDSILLPVSKELIVPIHVSIVKNVSLTTEGNCARLRINFHVPSSGNSNVSSHLVFPPLNGVNKIYLKEMTFKSHDTRSLPVTFKMIKDLQKKYKMKNQAETNKKGLVKQGPLLKMLGNKFHLDNLTVRPNISGKKTVGKLEVHKNGLLFKSTKNHELEILYNNVKHALLQPCDDELIILIHFRLLNEIIVGSKRTKDIQFLMEAGAQYDDIDTRNKRNTTEMDELEQEQREIGLKKRLNQKFINFVGHIEKAAKEDSSPLKFDVPYRELAFYGNTGRSIVKIMPTVNCFVNLIEFPFFVITIDEIEHVHFERVMLSLRNFDMIIILKDYQTWFKIGSIPSNQLDPIKSCIDYFDIMFSEGPATLNWNNILDEIRSNFARYLDDGAWSFLRDVEEEPDSEEEKLEKAEDSDYEMGSEEANETDDDYSGSGQSSDVHTQEEEEEEEDPCSSDAEKNLKDFRDKAKSRMRQEMKHKYETAMKNNRERAKRK